MLFGYTVQILTCKITDDRTALQFNNTAINKSVFTASALANGSNRLPVKSYLFATKRLIQSTCILVTQFNRHTVNSTE